MATGKNVYSTSPHRVKDKRAVSTLLVSFSLMALSSASNAFAQGAAGIYREKCSGCHTIGGGDLVGPDLAQCTTWSATKLEAEIKRMESNTGPLTEAEVKSLTNYLKAAKSDTGTSKEVPAAEALSNSSSPVASAATVPDASASAQKEPASAQSGRRLFYGDEAFKNGGLSCIACHSIDQSGGNMAPDLTLVSKKMQPAALISACEHTPYKVMKAAYKDHAILHQEALDLEAFLSSLKEPHERERKLPVGLLGGGLSAAILALIAVGYRGRNKTAREKLQRRD